jgi:hypothetical protein
MRKAKKDVKNKAKFRLLFYISNRKKLTKINNNMPSSVKSILWKKGSR